MRTSIRPCLATICSTALLTPRSSVTSTSSVAPPAAARSDIPSMLRAAPKTTYPSFNSDIAMLLPIPEEAPVTRAIRGSREAFINGSPLHRSTRRLWISSSAPADLSFGRPRPCHDQPFAVDSHERCSDNTPLLCGLVVLFETVDRRENYICTVAGHFDSPGFEQAHREIRHLVFVGIRTIAGQPGPQCPQD